MTKLCARGKAAAKRKFKVYPSAYANAYASKICAGKAKDPSGVKRKDWGPKKASLGSIISSGRGEKTYRQVLKSKLASETDPARRKKLMEYASVPLSGLQAKSAEMRLKEEAKKPLTMQSGGSAGSGAASSSGVRRLKMSQQQKKKQEIKNEENIFKKRKQDQKTKKQRLEEMRKELGMKKGGESKKKKMPKARDMAMGNKNIVYLGDPFIVDGKKFDPAKKFPKTYMRPEGAKTYSKGGYTGSHIRSEIGGKKVSNKSYEDYYKDLL